MNEFKSSKCMLRLSIFKERYIAKLLIPRGPTNRIHAAPSLVSAAWRFFCVRFLSQVQEHVIHEIIPDALRNELSMTLLNPHQSLFWYGDSPFARITLYCYTAGEDLGLGGGMSAY